MIKGKLQLTTVEGEGRRFTAESSSGHTVVFDDSHGNAGQRPIEAVLLALGGCTAFDVIGILRKMRQKEPQGKCRSCSSYGECLGGCTARAFAVSGST